MKTNKILSAIISVVTTANVLSSYATAWTKPEYSFDIEQYLCRSCSICDDFYTADLLDSEFAPNCVAIVLKGEYSYINSIWTIDDFPELAEAGLTVESVEDISAFYDKDDEWIEDYLSRVSFHQILVVNLGTYNYQKVRQVKDAIVEATLAGNHPEFSSVEFNLLYYPDNVEFIKGDVNRDGAVNAMDATLLARYAVGNDVTSEFTLLSADVNADEKFNAMDATMIARYAVGEIESFE